MGSSLLDPRRKRRRTRAHSAGFRHAGDKRCAVSLPWVAVLFGLSMAVAVGIRKGIKNSARNTARAARTRGRSAYPLAGLLEHHDIGPQAARFADPLRWCLANSAGDGGDGDGDDDPPTERLGLFTCVADTGFFLRAVGEASRFPLVTVVDLGDSLPRLGYEMGADTGLIFAGRDSEIVPETGLQARVKVGDPLPHTADLVLIEAHEEALSSDAWVDLIHSLMRVLSESGVVVIRGPREKKEKKEGAVGEADDAWYGNTHTHLWEAIATLACGGGHGVAAAVGDFDGGLIAVRHAAAGEKNRFGAGCGGHAGHQTEGDSTSAAGAARAIAPPNPLHFEGLFLWATGGQDQDATTAEAIEAVQAKFGGAEVVRRFARRRRERSACLSTNPGGEAAASIEPLVAEGGGDGHLRAKNRHSSPSHRGGATTPNHVASQQYLAARACLERHLQEHTQDVRAGFALEMVLRAIGGNGIDLQVARVRAKVIEESGPSGALLWRALHAQAASAAATGSLL